MSESITETISISARPQFTWVEPLSIIVQPYGSGANNPITITINGYNFDYTEMVCLSSNAREMFNLSTQTFNLFSTYKNLSALYTTFYGVSTGSYSIDSNNTITLVLSGDTIPLSVGQIDIIIVNGAGYGKSSTDENQLTLLTIH